MYDIETLRKDAWKYGCVNRDTKTKACEYGLLMFNLDTMERVVYVMNKVGNIPEHIKHLFELSEHTIYGIYLQKDNKDAYKFKERELIKNNLMEFQENIINNKLSFALRNIKVIKNMYKVNK